MGAQDIKVWPAKQPRTRSSGGGVKNESAINGNETKKQSFQHPTPSFRLSGFETGKSELEPVTLMRNLLADSGRR